MVEREHRSGVRVTIFDTESVSRSSGTHPSDLHLRKGDTKYFLVKHRPRLHTEAVPAPKASELSVCAGENMASVTGLDGYSSASLLQRLLWMQSSIHPIDITQALNPVTKSLWELYFGENPQDGTTVRFGKDGQLLEVEFLGHPNELMIDVMQTQAAGYVPELMVFNAQPESTVGANTFRRGVLKTGPCTPVTFHTELYDRRKRERHEVSYSADALFFIELLRRDELKHTKHERTLRRIASELRVGLSLLDHQEHKLRMYYSDPLHIDEDMFVNKAKREKTDKKEARQHAAEHRTHVLTQTLAALLRLSEHAVATGEVHHSDIQSALAHPVDDEILQRLEAEISQYDHHLISRKKVVKKKEQVDERKGEHRHE